MKILYLIGNGFDIHVGLKTEFNNFLSYYTKQPLPTGIDEEGQDYIKRLKDDINGNMNLWSYFELQYGKYMSKLGKDNANHTVEEEFDIINDDIRHNLSKYISLQDDKSFFTEDASKTFQKDIVTPELHLRDFEKSSITYLKINSGRATANVVDIVSFNYTHTLEHLLGKAPVQTSNSFTINEPIHVHGYHNRRMIMGVDNINQIENEELKKLIYVTETLVKTQCNHTYGVSHTDKTISLINSAQLICIYGLSFGDTDKTWWKTICTTLKSRNDVHVIIFWYGGNLPNFDNDGPKLQNIRRHVVEKFLVQGGVESQIREELARRVYVSVNAPIFDVKIKD